MFSDTSRLLVVKTCPNDGDRLERAKKPVSELAFFIMVN